MMMKNMGIINQMGMNNPLLGNSQLEMNNPMMIMKMNQMTNKMKAQEKMKKEYSMILEIFYLIFIIML